MNAVIETRKLSKWYGNVLGLSDVTLEVRPGITGLLGPNGAGKSTFMKLVTGQLKPSLGQVSIGGKKVRNNTEVFRRIGFCPEYDAFFEGLSGWQFLTSMIALCGFGRDEVETRAARALALVDLAAEKDRPVRAYSRGMRQRLKIAQALAHDPEIIILDEPLNGLDPLGKRKIIRLIRDYRTEGRTIVVSSHVLPEIEAMTREIILIHQGKILATGDVHTVRDMIEAHPHVVSVVCDRPRDLARLLLAEDDVISVQLAGAPGTVVVETRNRDRLFGRLPGLLVENGLTVEEITSPDDNLQAVFDYLVGK
jgi:ABC-2 type transport system ATP-binding protein